MPVKSKWIFLRCFFFCLWLMVYLGDGLKEMLIGTSIVILFGPLAIYFLVRLFRNQPSLIITDDYLYDNGSLASVGKLYWEEIEEVFIYKLANQKNLGIQVSNPDQVLERVGKVNRMMIKANKRIATANIAQTNVSVPLEEVFEIIEEKLKLRNAEGKGEGEGRD